MRAPTLREERFRAFLENCAEAFWCFEFSEPIPVDLPPDRQIELAYERGFLAEANVAMAKMYGFDVAEILGAPLAMLMPREESLDYLRSFIRSGYRLSDVESKEKDRDGRTKHFINNLLGALDGDRLVRVWGTQRDVTEKKDLEDQLRRSQKMEAIGRLAGGVAHDFNNLLSVILTYSSLLEAEAPDEWREDLSIIREAALRGADLSRQLLALGHHHVPRAVTIDLGSLVARLEKILRRLLGEQIELAIDVAPDLWPVHADVPSIEQIILGLVVSARDAMAGGGKLSLELANAEPSVPQVMLSIVDTGPATERDGLAIVLGLVKQNGGSVQGRPGSLEICFPREASPVEEPAPSPLPFSGDETVLLVDDDSSVRGAAAVILRRRGHRVLEAANPRDAIEMSERHRGPIHLLLTDVVMPKISGYELAAHLTLARPDLRALYMSGYAILEGTVPYLEKPFTPESLVAAVRCALGK